MSYVTIYFFGGPLHTRVEAVPKLDNEHLLGAPPEIQLVHPGEFPDYRDGDISVEVFGTYLRTAELEGGALVYRWDGPEWDQEMEYSIRGGD